MLQRNEHWDSRLSKQVFACVTERARAVSAVSWCGREFVNTVGRSRGNERCTRYR